MYCTLPWANVVGKNMGKAVQNMQGSILFGKLMEIYQNQTMKYRIFTNTIGKDTNSISNLYIRQLMAKMMKNTLESRLDLPIFYPYCTLI